MPLYCARVAFGSFNQNEIETETENHSNQGRKHHILYESSGQRQNVAYLL